MAAGFLDRDGELQGVRSEMGYRAPTGAADRGGNRLLEESQSGRRDSRIMLFRGERTRSCRALVARWECSSRRTAKGVGKALQDPIRKGAIGNYLKGRR